MGKGKEKGGRREEGGRKEGGGRGEERPYFDAFRDGHLLEVKNFFASAGALYFFAGKTAVPLSDPAPELSPVWECGNRPLAPTNRALSTRAPTTISD